MAENKMEAVAQLFGKKLNEPFKVRYLGEIITMEFTEDGLISSDLIYKGAIIRNAVKPLTLVMGI